MKHKLSLSKGPSCVRIIHSTRYPIVNVMSYFNELVTSIGNYSNLPVRTCEDDQQTRFGRIDEN